MRRAVFLDLQICGVLGFWGRIARVAFRGAATFDRRTRRAPTFGDRILGPDFGRLGFGSRAALGIDLIC